MSSDVGWHIRDKPNCVQFVSMVQCCFTSTETVRLIRTGRTGRPPRLSHSSWTLTGRKTQNYLLTPPPPPPPLPPLQFTFSPLFPLSESSHRADLGRPRQITPFMVTAVKSRRHEDMAGLWWHWLALGQRMMTMTRTVVSGCPSHHHSYTSAFVASLRKTPRFIPLDVDKETSCCARLGRLCALYDPNTQKVQKKSVYYYKHNMRILGGNHLYQTTTWHLNSS